MKVGIYKNLSIEDYHADKTAISRSGLLDYAKNPYTYYRNYIEGKRKKEVTDEMKLGTMFHTRILEPILFNLKYTMKPEKVLLKDVGREEYEKYKLTCEHIEQSGAILITDKEREKLLEMEYALNSNAVAKEMIDSAFIENSLFWIDEHSGLNLKARPDILHENMIVDLKTTSDASPRAFQNAMVSGAYHMQFAMIQDAVKVLTGVKIESCFNIVVETKWPFNVAIYKIDEFALEEGHKKYKQLCLDLKNSLAENKWESYGIQEISLPKWAI